MKKYLLYITTLIASFLVTSCLDDPFLEGCPEENNVPVQLTLSFSGSGPMSRDVTSSDETLDYTTDPQSAMIQDDVYVLVIDANDGEILYMIEDLEISNAGNGRYHDKVLRGTMQQTAVGETVKLVVLANLDQNQLTNASGDEISDVNAYLKTSTANGANISTIYNDLIYNYSAVSTNDDGESTSTPWNLDNRRIPMWGQTVATTVPANGMELDCFLYRAIAKVNIWINNKEGIKDSEGNFKFSINKITINNVNKQGYCAYVDESSTTKQPSSDITVQYTLPKEPAGVQQQDGIVYNDLNVTTSYSDMIYLPEQDNTGKAEGYTPVEMIVEYTYNGQSYTEANNNAGIIEFKDENGAFDVIRNHSYIFNITSVGSEFSLTCIVKEWEKETEEWDFTDNISESENLSWGSQGLNINSNTGEVIIPNTNEYNCTFGLLTPTGGTWQASLIPVGGVTDAFEFVGAHSGTIGESGTGTITLAIKAKYATVVNENNAAKLRIVVRTKDGRTLVANLTGSDKFSEYILVQNVNSSN